MMHMQRHIRCSDLRPFNELREHAKNSSWRTCNRSVGAMSVSSPVEATMMRAKRLYV